jgi:AbrB family looped-hinge helix DNA binding protein
MPTKGVGPKEQVVIPKQMREAIGIKPGAYVNLELREDEIVITKPKIEGNYTEYYCSTRSPKREKTINIKELKRTQIE